MHRRPSFAFARKRKRVEENAMPSPFLTEPKTEHLKCENVKMNGLELGHASMQGLRVSMEDEHIIDNISSVKDHTLVAIMDGENATFSVVDSSGSALMLSLLLHY
jgi:hypothetical protein